LTLKLDWPKQALGLALSFPQLFRLDLFCKLFYNRMFERGTTNLVAEKVEGRGDLTGSSLNT